MLHGVRPELPQNSNSLLWLLRRAPPPDARPSSPKPGYEMVSTL
ncbi:uncharacterized protein METZ01_LOCUS482731 [marine metagenome]|uniref:Uncharacterized protein n=1 Tax=marine metagenome TaxID=408172 RepID=A0A383CBY1_9ZZZZ